MKKENDLVWEKLNDYHHLKQIASEKVKELQASGKDLARYEKEFAEDNELKQKQKKAYREKGFFVIRKNFLSIYFYLDKHGDIRPLKFGDLAIPEVPKTALKFFKSAMGKEIRQGEDSVGRIKNDLAFEKWCEILTDEGRKNFIEQARYDRDVRYE